MKISFHLYANKTNFHMKSVCGYPRIHNEVHSNSEMTYFFITLYIIVLLTFQGDRGLPGMKGETVSHVFSSLLFPFSNFARLFVRISFA